MSEASTGDGRPRGLPFFEVASPVQGRRVVVLAPGASRLVIGRAETAEIRLDDDAVSRAHAVVTSLGEEWVVEDDNLSRNGTFVNGERLARPHRLRHGDRVKVGDTVLTFHLPGRRAGGATTRVVTQPKPPPRVSESQRRVLVALCRPYRAGAAFAVPASNREIAGEVFLTVDAVKTHLRALFARFEIADLPQNQKRVRLVELALQTGTVKESDFS